MDTKKEQKEQTKFYCEKCDFFTCRKANWKRHILTAKHKKVTNGNISVKKNQCDHCFKVYKFRSGLSRHKKKCPKIPKKTNNEISRFQSVIKEIVRDNEKKTELLDKLITEYKQLSTTNNTTNMFGCNNKISINVFLNEHCKNAMNLTDFVDNIIVSLEDLDYTNQHGYVKGISNIFVKHLTDMKVTERPIHCSDKKRLQFYIKDQDGWEKDKNNKKIDKTITDITMKQIKQLKEWESKNPSYLQDDELMLKWHTMVRDIMGSSEDPEREKDRESIKKEISDTISVKEAMV